MAARAYWRGHLRLSLVTIGVELYTAVARSNALAFHQIHRPTGKRIRYQKIAPGVGPVATEDIVRGLEVDKDRYITLEPEELDAVQLESKRTIDLVQFVPKGEIDPRYFEKPYYVVPEDSEVAAQGFAVIREALREAGRIALGQMAVRGRDSIVAISPCGRGLLLETLRYAEEIRESDKVFRDVPDVAVDEEMRALAEQLIAKKSAPFDPDRFASEYSRAVMELVERKRQSGQAVAVSEDPAPRAGTVVDLMEALRRSVEGETKARPTTKSAQKPRAAAAKTPVKRKSDRSKP